MAKPTKFEDLPESEQHGPIAFTINTDMILRMPHKVAAALLNLADAADGAVGLIAEEGEGWRNEASVTFRCVITDEEKAAALVHAQRQWEYKAQQYDEARLRKPNLYYSQWAVDRWAKDEGREPIDWSFLDDEEAAA